MPLPECEFLGITRELGPQFVPGLRPTRAPLALLPRDPAVAFSPCPAQSSWGGLLVSHLKSYLYSAIQSPWKSYPHLPLQTSLQLLPCVAAKPEDLLLSVCSGHGLLSDPFPFLLLLSIPTCSSRYSSHATSLVTSASSDLSVAWSWLPEELFQFRERS